jgi:hypothetical protein
MKTLLALDPGKTTGISIWQFDANTPLTHIAHHQCEQGLEGFIRFMMPHEKVAPFDVIVSESFKLDGRTPNPDITPLKIEGALDVMSVLMQAPLYFQPNNFKAHVDNGKLKEHNLYWPGQQHAMDSARHAITWAMIQRHMPTLLEYFGPVE